MTYDAVFACSVALLRGCILQAGAVQVRPRRDRLVYDQALWFVESVGERTALVAARRVMQQKNNKKVKWI